MTRPPCAGKHVVAADDPRHGTYAGTVAHWHANETPCPPCAQAGYLYGKRLRCESAPRMLPNHGYRRRLQALQAIGYSIADIVRMLDTTPGTLTNRLYRSAWVSRTNFEILAAVYEAVCMHPNPTPDVRTIKTAQRNGYAPPLAWDDIDDPAATPYGADDQTRSVLDPVVVERLLAGDRVPSNRAEKVEALRRWVAWGNSARSLEVAHGWKTGRYDQGVAA